MLILYNINSEYSTVYEISLEVLFIPIIGFSHHVTREYSIMFLNIEAILVT